MVIASASSARRGAGPTLSPVTAPRLSVAPMMEWTDRHCRALHRLLAPNALLYTEMITTGALIHGPRERLLRYGQSEHPVAIQLGGCDPEALAFCTALADAAGYDEVNLNVGCPSQRVRHARIGVCLMREPDLVAEALSRMQRVSERPVTVKCRLGLDDDDDYAFLHRFVATLVDAGLGRIIVHARKALLGGLTPAQNRSVPPLSYEPVKRLKHDFPGLEVVVNGGIDDADRALELLRSVDGVMIGRSAYQNPWFLTTLEERLFGTAPPVSRRAVIEAYLPYMRDELDAGTRLHDLTRHMLGLFNGLPGARRYRRILSERARRPGAGLEVLREALAQPGEPASGVPRQGHAPASDGARSPARV